MSQKNSSIGAIGEHMVAAQLMLHKWDAFNANASITNMCAFDLICLNEQKQTALIQVKTTEQNSFPVGITMAEAKDRKKVEQHVVGPWVFVKINGEGAVLPFEYYILSRAQVVEMIWKSNDWYLHKVDRGNKIVKEASVCAIMVEWLNGKNYNAPRLNAETFINPLNGKSAQDEWDKIWENTTIPEIKGIKPPMEESMALFCVDFADVKDVYITHFECERIYHIDEAAFARSVEQSTDHELSNSARNELSTLLHNLSLYKRGYYFELSSDQEWNCANYEPIKVGDFKLSEGTILRPYRYKLIAQANDNEILEITWFDYALDLRKSLLEIIAPRVKKIEYRKHVRYFFDENNNPIDPTK